MCERLPSIVRCARRTAVSKLAGTISGKVYRFLPNPIQVKSVSLMKAAKFLLTAKRVDFLHEGSDGVCELYRLIDRR